MLPEASAKGQLLRVLVMVVTLVSAAPADVRAHACVSPPDCPCGSSKIAFEARFLGRSLAYTYEVRELEPGARLVMSTDEGPFPMETTYTWHDTPTGGTHMTLRNRGEPSGFANLAAPLMSAQMRRSTTRDLKLLKSLMETRQSA